MKNFLAYTKFFGESGVTSTSANYLSNIAKEIINTYTVLKDLSFESKHTKALSDPGAGYAVQTGISQEDFNKLEEILLWKSKLSALISWFREAIKARERQLNVIEETTFDDWMEMMDITLEVGDSPIKPESDNWTTEGYIQEFFNVKEMNEYFFLSNICAHLGKFIHPNGVYASAKAAIEKSNNKCTLRETNSENLLTTVTTSIPVEEINKKFFELQDKQRSYQKRLNEILFNVEKEVTRHNDEQRAKMDVFYAQYQKWNAEYEAKKSELVEQFGAWKVKELNSLRSKKIIIPNELEDVYKFVQEYGKTK